MTKSGKKTADFAEDTDGEKKSAPSVLSAVKSPAPTGRNMPAQGKERSDAALGHPSQNTSSPEPERSGDRPPTGGPEGVTEGNQRAKQGGELPRGWSEQGIEQLFAPLEDGRTLHQGWSPQCDKVPSPSEDIWGVLKTTSIQAGEFQPEHNKLLPPGLEPRPMIEVKEGDILLTCAGPRVRCGVSCLVRQTRKRLMMSGKMYRFRVNPDEHDARYIEAFLQTERALQAIDKMKTGSSDSGLNLTHERFRQLPVPVAPLPEQRRIVAEIEKQFTRLEAGVAALGRVQANLKRHRAAVLKAACEGRLVPTEAALARSPRSTKNAPPAYETGEALIARILTERRQNWQGRGQYKEAAALDTAKLFDLPAGWTWTTLDALAEIKGGITKDQNRKHTAPARSVPYLRVANVQRGYIDLTEVKEIVTTEDEIQELALRPGDILFNEGGDRDKLGRGWVWNGELPECIHQNHVFRAQLYVAALNPKLVSWYANTFGQKFFFDEGKHTTNLASISMSKLKGLPVPIPPPAEQTRIVAEVERRLSVVEELESVVTANLQRATRLRQSILKTAFLGIL